MRAFLAFEQQYKNLNKKAFFMLHLAREEATRVVSQCVMEALLQHRCEN